MGIIKKGILGGFSGKVGNVVGASWRSIQYIRSLPSNVRNPRTDKQVSQRTKFSLIVKFIRSVLPIARIGFKDAAGAKTSAYNAAVSYNMNNAIKGDYPDFEIDFPKVVLARGPLYGLSNVSVVSESGNLEFGWNSDLVNNASPLDRLMLLAYNPDKEIATFNIDAATRADGTASLPLSEDWVGDDVEAFAVLISEDGTMVSDSIYVGRQEVVDL